MAQPMPLFGVFTNWLQTQTEGRVFLPLPMGKKTEPVYASLVKGCR
jgi:hypothetical protein